jgi:transposase
MENNTYNGQPITDGIKSGIEARKQRGLEIAALARIDHRGSTYSVPSQSQAKLYTVRYGISPICDCPDHELRRCRCKHIYAVEYVIRREHRPDGSVTESVTVTKTRKTYPQNWPAYNEAQQNEKREFQRLLFDLCKDIVTPPQAGRGQRRLPMSDAIFAAAFKVYSTMSARRFTSDLCDAQAKGYIRKVPHFNSVLNVLDSEETTPILLALIERCSLPLRSVESCFAVDSTGFAYSRFVRWYDIKYNRFTSEQQWVKAHLCTGVKTNVVTSVEIHGRNTNDAPQLPSLLKSTAENFTVKEVSADKGYLSRDNLSTIKAMGAKGYIPFKTNSKFDWDNYIQEPDMTTLWSKMFHFFQFKKEQFLAHYHKRSNVESTVMMIKSKFGDAVRSKTDVSAKNEVLAKILCHNICCVISAIYELGIEPEFCTTKESAAQQKGQR